MAIRQWLPVYEIQEFERRLFATRCVVSSSACGQERKAHAALRRKPPERFQPYRLPLGVTRVSFLRVAVDYTSGRSQLPMSAISCGDTLWGIG